jgi:hypothetical protein
MRPVTVLPIVAVFAMSVPQLMGADASAQREQLRQLILQLGSNRFEDREEASQTLEACGSAALDALRTATRSTDPEVRRRATALVRQIEQRMATAQFLAPQRVRLHYQGTPLAEAIEDFSRRTGLPIKVQMDKNAPADRPLTLNTGEVPFWEALEQFCGAGNLMEKKPASERSPGVVVSSTEVIIVNGNIRPMASNILHGDITEKPESLVLTAGKARPLPTHYAGALRIQALPPEAAANPDKEVMVTLEITVEPRLKWQKPLGLRIQEARDEHGQSLAHRPKPLSAPVVNGAMIVNGVPYTPDSTAAVRQVPVRLQAGEKPSKVLKELSGTLTGLVQSDIEALVTVDRVLQASGQQVRGAGGSSVKVLTVSRQDDGQIKLGVQVESPPRGLNDGSSLTGNTIMIVNGRRVGVEDESLRAANFALLDNKGRPFEVVRAENTGRRAGLAQELELIYQPTAEQTEPARFVYRGRRSVVVEVPFRLEDVPLP